jgi:dynein intermediate chain 1
MSDQLENDEDLGMMDQNNMGGIDQEQLTAEEKEEQIIKSLTSHNPQAPHNLCYFSFKDRAFKVEEQVDNLVFHFQIDGRILLKESEEA